MQIKLLSFIYFSKMISLKKIRVNYCRKKKLLNLQKRKKKTLINLGNNLIKKN